MGNVTGFALNQKADRDKIVIGKVALNTSGKEK